MDQRNDQRIVHQRAAIYEKPVLCALFLAATLSSCGVGDSPSTTPSITLFAVSPKTLVLSDPAQKTLELALSFRDADGDVLGGIVRLVDRRTASRPSPTTFTRTLPAPAQARDASSGIVTVRVDDVGIVSEDGESVTYDVTLFDRAGHASNTIVTTPVVVRR